MNLTECDFERLRIDWETLLLGRAIMEGTWNPEGFYEREAIASIQCIADAKVEKTGSTGDDSVCCDNSEYYQLHAIAVAWRTPGTTYYRNADILKWMRSRLETLYETEYNIEATLRPGCNWWVSEIGIPLRLVNILVLLNEDLADTARERDELIEKYTDVILFSRDALARLGAAPETSTNMIWRCQILYLTGILRREAEWLEMANRDMKPLFACEKRDGVMEVGGRELSDGFYEDGSYIQHHTVAYTGGYGKNFIQMTAYLLYAFGSEKSSVDQEPLLGIGEKERAFFAEAVHRCYEPLICRGRFMDLARGREISRFGMQDYMTGRHIMRYLCYLALAMGEPEKSVMTAMLKEWLSCPCPDWEDREHPEAALLKDVCQHAEHFVLPSLPEVLRQIMESGVPQREPLEKHCTFSVMSKPVHRAARFSAAVSIYSRQISCYERMNTESTKLWHISDGVTYVYTGDADQYNGDFYATADMQRLPGITVDRNPERYKEPYLICGDPRTANAYAFAGGAETGKYGIVGFQTRGRGRGLTMDLEVRKSWFFLGDEILCMGSGISSTSGDPIETVVDQHRLLPAAPNVLTWQEEDQEETCICSELQKSGEKLVRHPRWVHLGGNCGEGSDMGYYFPEDTDLHILSELREGTWNTVKVNPANCKRNSFATFYISHGICPQNAGYAYAMLPGMNPESVRNYAEKPCVKILENSVYAHAAASEKITGINFWSTEGYACAAAGVFCDRQASVIIEKADDGKRMKICVSDPTQTDQVIRLRFSFSASLDGRTDPAVRVLSEDPFEVSVDTAGKNGASVVILVKKSPGKSALPAVRSKTSDSRSPSGNSFPRWKSRCRTTEF